MPEIRGLGAVKDHVRAAAEEIAARFNLYNIGGFASSGHISNSDHYTGHAIDVMVSNMRDGEMVAKYTHNNQFKWGVKYIIWNRQIIDYRNDKGWEPYSGSSPHTDHVHISFFTKPGSKTGTWTGDETNQTAEALSTATKLLGEFGIRAAGFVLGGALIIAALLLFSGRQLPVGKLLKATKGARK